MKNSDKVLIGVGLGLLAGGLAGYFLATDKGKEFQAEAKKKINAWSEIAQEELKDGSEIVSEKISTATEIAKSMATDITETVKQKINETEAMVENDFQNGVNNARKVIEEQKNTITEMVKNNKTA